MSVATAVDTGRAESTGRAANPHRARARRNAPAAIAATIAVVRLLSLGPHFADDAYISFRYATNLADGQGLVFNAGRHVEGYSNFLWTVVLAAASRLDVNVPITAVVLGGTAFVAAVVLTVVTAQRAGLRNVHAGLIGGLVAVLPSTAGSSVNGLETSLFLLGLATALYALIAPGRRAPLAAAAAMLLIGLSRPEGIVLAVGFGVVYLATRPSIPNGERRRALVAVGVSVAILGGWKLWSRWYFGRWLPMSALAKRDGDVGLIDSLHRSIGPGLDYVIIVVGRFWMLVALAAIVLGAVTWRQLDRPQRLLIASGAAMCAFGTALAVANKGDWMPFARLLAPYLPAFILVVGILVDVATRQLPRRAFATAALPITLAALLLLQPLAWNAGPGRMDYPADDFGRAIARAHAPDDVIAVGLLGRIGYFARPTPIEDIYGLTEPAVATSPQRADVFGKFDPAYTASTNPTLIMDNAWGDLFAITHLASGDYVALAGRSLSDDHLFAVVRHDAAPRYLTALRGFFSDVHLVDLDTAHTTWSEAYPNDASQAPPP